MGDIFNHLAALVSIILSLGIANLVAFVATLVHRQRKVRLDAAQLLWAAAIFLAQIEFWLSIYAFRTSTEVSVPSILFVIFLPVLHYLQAVLVVPDYQPGEVMDLKAHHAANHREYIGAGVVADLLTMAYLGYMTASHPSASYAGAFMVGGFFAVTGLIAMFVSWRWVQIVVPALHLALRVLYLPALAASLAA